MRNAARDGRGGQTLTADRGADQTAALRATVLPPPPRRRFRARRTLGQALRTAGLAGLVALAGSAGGPVLAQTMSPLHQDMALGQISAPRMLAARLTGLALESLRQAPATTPAALGYAALLLDQALEQDPADAERWLLRSQLALRQGDLHQHQTSLRRYLALRPQDDAAQLRLALGEIESAPTLDQRLALAERLLERGALPATVRARLAAYAARAAEELGREREALAYTTRAARLDGTLAESAGRVHALLARHGGDPLRRAGAAVNLIRASPRDPWPRLEMAGQLVGQAAYADATVQFLAASRLSPEGLPPQSYHVWIFAEAAAGRASSALRMIEQIQQSVATLPSEVALLRLLIGASATAVDRSTAYAAVRASIEAEDGRGAVAWTDLPWIAAWAGQDAPLLAEHLRGLDPKSDEARLLGGLQALVLGEAGQVRERLAGLEAHPLAAYALVLASGYDRASEAQALRAVVHRAPNAYAALLSALRIHSYSRDIAPTPAGVSMRTSLDRFDRSVLLPPEDLASWVSLEALPLTDRFAPGEPVSVRVTMQNTSPLPLALGRDGTLPTQVLLEPQARIGGEGPATALPPTVVDLGRRLVLAPGEAVSVTATLAQEPLRQLLLTHPFQPVTLSVGVLLDPRPGPDGRLVAGARAQQRTIEVLRIQGRPASEGNLAYWVEQAASPDVQERLQALERLGAVAIAQSRSDLILPMSLWSLVGEALTGRFLAGGPAEQAWILLACKPPVDDGAFAAPSLRRTSELGRIEEHAQRSDALLVRMAYLISQVRRADHDALIAALRHEDPAIRAFARLYQQHLRPDESVEAFK